LNNAKTIFLNPDTHLQTINIGSDAYTNYAPINIKYLFRKKKPAQANRFPNHLPQNPMAAVLYKKKKYFPPPNPKHDHYHPHT
jgi:hypothetical protein